jgi:hypothetical protein
MSRWDAPSDLDYYNEACGPELVARECEHCGETFTEPAVGDYVMHPLCDWCKQELAYKLSLKDPRR